MKVRNCGKWLNLVLVVFFICSSYKAHGKNLKVQVEEFKDSVLESSDSKGDESKDNPDSSTLSSTPSSSSPATDNTDSDSDSDLDSNLGLGSDCPGGGNPINPTTRKCVTVLASEVVTYSLAKSICGKKNNSNSIVWSLLTVESEEEQNAVNQLIFNTFAVPDNIWLDGYRRLKSDDDNDSNQGFKWFDGTNLGYSNWRQGGPSDRYTNKCIQMAPDGQWADVNCHKKNVAVCQTVRRITLESLQSAFVGFRKTFKAKLKEHERLLNETRKLVMDLALKVQKQEQAQAQKQKQEPKPQQELKQQQTENVKNQNVNPIPAPNVTAVCEDKSPYCGAMEPGQCQDSKQGVWYRVMCRKTCGECNTPEFSGCMDKDDKCSKWGKIGECGRNPDFMKDVCQKTCGVCS